MASIESPRAKFDRATQQCEALGTDLSTLRNLNSYTITKDIDNATGEQIYRFAKVPPIPNDLSLRLGEMLYNFRCSLDHLIEQLVLSKGNVPTTRNEFPIFECISEYETNKGGKLKGVSDAVIDIIDSLQPCNSTGDSDYWSYLWYLRELCNADKHRHLLLTRRALGKLRVVWTSTELPKVRYFNTPVEDGTVFLQLEPNVDVEVHPTILIIFSNAPPSIRKDLPVENIIQLIHTSVWEVFERLRSHVK